MSKRNNKKNLEFVNDMPYMTELFDIFQTFMADTRKHRSIEPVQTFGDNIELEMKFDIKKSSDVKNLLMDIKNLDISMAEMRFEWHHFFAKEDILHYALILSNSSSEVWIKNKKDKTILYTKNKLPILFRHENKISPKNKGYENAFREVVSNPFIGSFKKICIDFYFWFNNLSFAVTLSLAYDPTKKSKLYQIEFEYDGHMINTSAPDFEYVISKFEELIDINFSYLISDSTEYTKIEWLRKISKKI